MSELNDFITAAHERDLKFTEAIARMAQAQEDMNTRLFGNAAQQGVLPHLIAKIDESSKEQLRQVTAVANRTTVLENWRGASRAWLAGAVAVLTLEGTALGLYFSKIASHVQALHK